MLDWHIGAAGLSGVFSVVAGFIYIKDILRGGETKPSAVSFFIWTVLQLIALIAQISSGASWSVVIVIFVTLNTGVVTVLALSGYGYRGYATVDFVCFALAVAAIVGWQVTGEPLLAIAFSIAGDLFAAVPTLVKTYRNPRSEYTPAWALITLASVLGVLSTDRFDAANLAYPVYLTLANGAICALAYFGRRQKRP